jgi:hypothetical protein
MPHLPEDSKDEHAPNELIPDVPSSSGTIERMTDSALATLQLSTSPLIMSQDGFGSSENRVADTPNTGTGRSHDSQLETSTGYLTGIPQPLAGRRAEIWAGVNTDNLLSEADKLLKSFDQLDIVASSSK